MAKHPGGKGTQLLTCLAERAASSAPNRRSGARSGLATGARREQAREAAQGRRGSRADEGGGASAAAVRRREAMGAGGEGRTGWSREGEEGVLAAIGCGSVEQPGTISRLVGWMDGSTRRALVFSFFS